MEKQLFELLQAYLSSGSLEGSTNNDRVIKLNLKAIIETYNEAKESNTNNSSGIM